MVSTGPLNTVDKRVLWESKNVLNILFLNKQEIDILLILNYKASNLWGIASRYMLGLY